MTTITKMTPRLKHPSHVLVYRMANDVDEGPFGMNRLSYANNVKMIQHSMRFPEPYDDGIYPIPSDDYVCGCASLRMLKSWFRPVWDNLLQCDFEVKVYSVHPRYVRYGGKQVVFNYKKAKRVL